MTALKNILLSAAAVFSLANAKVAASNTATFPDSCGPLPTDLHLKWQEMEMYAFIHYSLNTYTGEEWGYGNESPGLFNPSDLDVRQWVDVCMNAGMKGIIFTAKHHCGFCMWPSAYTDYSVKSSPWENGQGDVVRQLAEACKEKGLKFAVYLSPWDRNHPEYGSEGYVTYFRNQLRELLTGYGDMFEVWFDGANGGDGWYGGADGTRQIDRTTYYGWPETYNMVRGLQPSCLIWNDGSDRGDLRWIGTEKGEAGSTNWSLLNREGKVTASMRRHGLEQGDSWVPGETNTSIRPGWFYHPEEDAQVKTVSKLMETYYKSVGRNSTLLLNFPVMPNGRIHPTDSIRGVEFANAVAAVFRHDLAQEAKVTASQVMTGGNFNADNVTDGDKGSFWSPGEGAAGGSLEFTFESPVEINRFLAEEYIPLGQRVKTWRLEVMSEGEWKEINDALSDEESLTTIGNRRIVCFPTVKTEKVRFTITQSKADPLIRRVSMYHDPNDLR